LNKKPRLLAVTIVALLFAAGALHVARAQTTDAVWGEPVNLSRSGAASRPQIVVGLEDDLQVFWWDEFDGLMTSYRDGRSWAERARAPIIVTEIEGEGARAEVVRTPVSPMPAIFGGTDNAHAFWLGKADEETGIQPLLHSRVALSTTTWSEPASVAETARAWRMVAGPDGTLHLLTLRPLHTEEATAGVYYQRSTDQGGSWSDPRALYQTIYFRLVAREEAHLWLTADDEGRVYANWDDPRRQETYLAVSTDGGATWAAPEVLGGEREARRARVTLAPEEPLLLWEETGTAAGCVLQQQRVTPPVTGTLAFTETVDLGLSEPEQVLEELRACPEAPAFYRPGSEGPLMVLTGQGLTTAAWNGAQWAEPKSLTFSFEHPELGRQVYPEQFETTLVDERLAVVGIGQGGDVWYLESGVDAWEWVFAPPPPWSPPGNVSQSARVAGLPALTVDPDGRLHAVWGDPVAGLVGDADEELETASGALTYARLDPPEDGTAGDDGPQWSRPAAVLQTPDGGAVQPVLVGRGERLYALWSGGDAGTIYLSRAFTRDAYAPGGWSEPEALPMGGVTASSPAALVDAHGVLHVVYAAPLNEGRGIYYLRSDRATAPEGDHGDEGEAVDETGSVELGPWGEPQLIFDAQEAGFSAVDHPALALDPAGTLHVVWVRGSTTGPFPPQAVFHAQSGDGGQSWSEPRILAEGGYDWPLVAAPVPGEVHVLWNQVDGGGWTHRWSLDYGQTWTYQQQVRGFRDVPGPAGLRTDGAGNLHLVGLGPNEQGAPALHYGVWRWEEERWEQQDPFSVDPARETMPGVAAALTAGEGRLDVAFRARMPGESAGQTRPDVVHARRAVAVVTEEQEPAYTPVPTVTPLPTATPAPTPSPRAPVEAAPPPSGPPSVTFGPLSLPLMAMGGIGLALIIVLGVLATRGARRGR
jgi:hypothetical protein